VQIEKTSKALASVADASEFHDAVAFVHQFVLGTPFVREFSRQDNILVAAFTLRPRNRTAELRGGTAVERQRISLSRLGCAPAG
jgi:hypothetical protein